MHELLYNLSFANAFIFIQNGETQFKAITQCSFRTFTASCLQNHSPSKETPSFSPKQTLSPMNCSVKYSHVYVRQGTAYQAITNTLFFPTTSASLNRIRLLLTQRSAEAQKRFTSTTLESQLRENLKKQH